MKEMLIKFAKGLALGALFGGLTYLVTKDIGTAGLIALVMVLSMFARSKNDKIQGAEQYTKLKKKNKK